MLKQHQQPHLHGPPMFAHPAATAVLTLWLQCHEAGLTYLQDSVASVIAAQGEKGMRMWPSHVCFQLMIAATSCRPLPRPHDNREGQH